MPRGDGTGPLGLGPMTGRAAGYCAGYPVPGFANPFSGRHIFGRGGRGYRNWFYATGLTGWQRALQGLPAWGCFHPGIFPPIPEVSKEQQVNFLKEQAKYFEDTLEEIRKRIKDLQSEETE